MIKVSLGWSALPLKELELKIGYGKKKLLEGKWLVDTHTWTPLPWLSWQPWKSLKALKGKKSMNT